MALPPLGACFHPPYFSACFACCACLLHVSICIALCAFLLVRFCFVADRHWLFVRMLHGLVVVLALFCSWVVFQCFARCDPAPSHTSTLPSPEEKPTKLFEGTDSGTSCECLISAWIEGESYIHPENQQILYSNHHWSVKTTNASEHSHADGVALLEALPKLDYLDIRATAALRHGTLLRLSRHFRLHVPFPPSSSFANLKGPLQDCSPIYKCRDRPLHLFPFKGSPKGP